MNSSYFTHTHTHTHTHTEGATLLQQQACFLQSNTCYKRQGIFTERGGSPSWNKRRLPRWLRGKESACQRRRHRRPGFDSCVRKIPGRTAWQPTPVFLPGESHGQRSLVGYRPQSGKESDMCARTQTQAEPMRRCSERHRCPNRVMSKARTLAEEAGSPPASLGKYRHQDDQWLLWVLRNYIRKK